MFRLGLVKCPYSTLSNALWIFKGTLILVGELLTYIPNWRILLLAIHTLLIILKETNFKTKLTEWLRYHIFLYLLQPWAPMLTLNVQHLTLATKTYNKIMYYWRIFFRILAIHDFFHLISSTFTHTCIHTAYTINVLRLWTSLFFIGQRNEDFHKVFLKVFH